MTDPDALRTAILEKMSTVIDPDTGINVVRMRLIEDLAVDTCGHVAYKFRPSSVFCPIAVPLAESIRQAVAQVPGVTSQDLQIVGLALSDELTAAIREAMAKAVQQHKEEKEQEQEEDGTAA